MLRSFASFVSAPQVVCYEGETDSSPGAGDADKNASGAGKTFTQDEMNKILADDKRKHQAQLQKVEAQLQQVASNNRLSDDERATLNSSIEDIQKQMRTKEQQATIDKQNLENTYKTKLTDAEKRANEAETKYVDSTIRRSLQDAALLGDAFNPSQVVELLRSKTKMVNDVPMVDFEDRHAETGEVISTQLPPADAVKRMKEMNAIYGNLFKSNIVSGIGGSSRADGSGADGKVDVRKLTPEQYAKMRKENPSALGLRK